MLGKWHVSLDKGFGGAVLMVLSKPMNTLNHDILLAKLYAQGFHIKASLLTKSYYSNRFQRSGLILGVPQGSVL